MHISKIIRRQIVAYSSDWIKKFDVRDYVLNPPLIEKLHEEKQIALASSLDLEAKAEKMEAQIRELELENSRLSALANTLNQRGLVGSALSILSVVLMGIGVNIVTGKPYTWAGWVMIGVACVIQITIFFVRPKIK